MWLMIRAVEQMDTGPFYGCRSLAGRARPAMTRTCWCWRGRTRIRSPARGGSSSCATLDLFAADSPSDWRNRLIWRDKKYVLPALLSEFAGQLNMIYIDPPFA
ncbi:MAG TPA: hypothetical protein VF940_01080, partial [Streptosporangiaceae bacterium]